MYTLIFSVVAALAVSGDAVQLLKLSRGCEEVQSCLKPLFSNSFGYSFIINETIKGLSVKSKYDDFCQKENEFRSCYISKQQHCENHVVKETVFSAMKIVDFICSANGKEALAKVASSKCLTDETTRKVVQDKLAQCFVTYEGRAERLMYNHQHIVKKDDFCCRMGQLSRCVSGSFWNRCDQELFKFIKKIEEAAFNHILVGCTQKRLQTPPAISAPSCAAMDQCLSLLSEANKVIEDRAVDILIDRPGWTKLCQNNKDFQICYDKNKHQCSESFLKEVSHDREMLGRYCTDDILTGLENLMNTSCYTNKSASSFLHSSFYQCGNNSNLESLMTVYNYESKDADLCRVKAQEVLCVNASMIRHCGHDFASLVDQVLNLTHVATQILAKTNCASLASLSDQDCDDLLKCVDPLYEYGFDTTYGGSLQVLTKPAKLEQLCQKSAGFQKCIENTKDKCKSSVLLTSMSTSVEMLKYLCSDLVKGGLKLIADSDCVTNEAVFMTAENQTQECVKNYQKDHGHRICPDITDRKSVTFNPICPHLNDAFGLQSCIASNLNYFCGDAFTYIAKKLRKIADRPLAKLYGCDRMFNRIPEGCEPLVECVSPVYDAGFEEMYEETVCVLSDEQKYNSLCQLKTELQTCYNAKKDECKEDRVLNKVYHLTKTLDNLCSEDIKKDLQKLANSAYVKNATVQFKSRLGALECKQKFDKELYDINAYAFTAGEDVETVNVCPLLAQESKCIIDSMTLDCREEVAAVGKKLWHIQHFPRYEALRCDGQFRPTPEARSVVMSSPGCVDVIQCFLPLKKYGYRADDFTKTFNVLFDNIEYDELCDAYDKFHCCYSDKKDTCNSSNILYLMDGKVELLKHLCSSEGRNALRKLSKSRCASDCYTEFAVHLRLDSCMDNFNSKSKMGTYYARVKGDQPDTVNYCNFIGQLQMCIATSLNDRCDSRFAAYINKVWNIHFSPFLKLFGCDARLNKISSGADKGCDDLEACTKVIPVPDRFAPKVPHEKLFNKICQIQPTLQPCYNVNVGKCTDSYRSAHQLAAVEMAEYMCSTEGKEGHKQNSNNTCVTDKETALDLHEALVRCTDTYYLDLKLDEYNATISKSKACARRCLILDKRLRCYVSAMTELCGKAYARYAKELWHIANAPSIKIDNCDVKPIPAAGCEELVKCKNILYEAGFEDTYDGKLRILYNRTKYIEICQLKSDFEKCYSRNNGTCENTEQLISMVTVLDFLDYMCFDLADSRLPWGSLAPDYVLSPKLIQRLSACNTDDTVHRQLQGEVKACLKDYELDILVAQRAAELRGEDPKSINVRPHLLKQKDCLFGVVGSRCDYNFFKVAFDFWYIDNMYAVWTKGLMDNSCDELKKCRTLLNDGDCNNTDILRRSPLAESVDFDNLCEKNKAFQACYSLKKDECFDSYIVNLVKTSAEILNEACANKNNPLYKEIIASPCVTESSNLLNAEAEAERCLRNFKTDKNKLLFKYGAIATKRLECLKVQSVYDCGENALISHCGKAFASKLYKLWGRVELYFRDRIVCPINRNRET